MKLKNNEDGWLMIEAMGALLVVLISIPIFYNLWAFARVGEEQAIVAGQLKTISEGFEDYVSDNYSTFVASSTATTATATSFSTMKAGGYVTAGINGTNIWGQGYVNYVLQPEPNTLEIITLTTGGTRSDSDFLNQVVPGSAVKLGSKGGYIPSGLISGQATTTLQGTYNGWQKSLTGTTIPSPGAGHLAYYSTTNDTGAGQDFLYRKSVPGNPQLNTMETTLNMGSNSITGVDSIQLDKLSTVGGTCVNADEGKVVFNDSEGLLVCRQNKYSVIADTDNSALVKEVEQVWHGSNITKPTCPSGTGMVPRIYVTPSVVSSSNLAAPMHSIQAWAIDYSTYWQVQMRVLTDPSWIYPDSNYVRGVALVTCEKN